MDMSVLNDAYAEGYADAFNHVPLEMNPFYEGSAEYEAYEHGWDDARYEIGIEQFEATMP